MTRVTSRRDINECTQEGVLKKNRLFKQIRCCIFACSKPCSLIICLPHFLIDVTRFPSKNLASCRVTRRIRRIIIISVRATRRKRRSCFFFSKNTKSFEALVLFDRWNFLFVLTNKFCVNKIILLLLDWLLVSV